MTLRFVYVRCPTCNRVLANKEYLYQQMISNDISIKEALDSLGLVNICCRARMMSHVDSSKDMLEQKYYNYIAPLNPPPELSSLNEYPELNDEKNIEDNFEEMYKNKNDSLFDFEENVSII